jgi:hypothetical protein
MVDVLACLPQHCPAPLEMTVTALVLNLKSEYFDAIRNGSKTEEFRLRTPYWEKRIKGRDYTAIILRKGYPKTGDAERELVLPWRGYREIDLEHPHFGEGVHQVFAIDVATDRR